MGSSQLITRENDTHFILFAHLTDKFSKFVKRPTPYLVPNRWFLYTSNTFTYSVYDLICICSVRMVSY